MDRDSQNGLTKCGNEKQLHDVVRARSKKPITGSNHLNAVLGENCKTKPVVSKSSIPLAFHPDNTGLSPLKKAIRV